MSDSIEKRVDIEAPISRVWRALIDHQEFGAWFCVKLTEPFEEGRVSRGHITHPGYEHVIWEATVQRIVPERLFSFTWHPYAVDPNVDYSTEATTLVEFILEPTDGGARVIIKESGFDSIPKNRQFKAFRMNEAGWTQQSVNIKRHVEQPN